MISGCATLLPEFRLNVVNLCWGPNTTVNVYLNDVYRGRVTYTRTFPIAFGALALRAVGTGVGGAVFTNSTFVSDDLIWTLCPIASADAQSLDASTATESAR